jgi:hypothetical protein
VGFRGRLLNIPVFDFCGLLFVFRAVLEFVGGFSKFLVVRIMIFFKN